MERLTLSQAKKKYSDIHENGRDYGVRRAFEILINDKPYQVWDIAGYEHKNGEWNGTPTTWWLNFKEDGDEESELVPFVDKGVHRICWEVKYKQKNYAKHKYGDWDIRNSGHCRIYANGKQVISFGSRNLEYAMAKVPVMIVKIMEHPFNFLNPQEENGRKIWYHGMPATVSVNEYSEPGEISVVPDYTTGIEPNTWWKLYNERRNPVVMSGSEIDQDDMDSDLSDLKYEERSSRINHGDALWDGMINWFRKSD